MTASATDRRLQAAMQDLLDGDAPSYDALVEVWQHRLPQLLHFKDTPQDKDWHAEGDVEVHTRMVLDETYALLDDDDVVHAHHVDAHRRAALVLGALLHDIAKPLTTCEREIQGRLRVAAPKHEDMGRSLLAPALAHAGLPADVVEDVLGLVGEHIAPKFLVVKDAPAGKYVKLARQVCPQLVYLLEVADMRGRICADQDDQLDLLEMFKLTAQEHGAFERFAGPLQWRRFLREHRDLDDVQLDWVLARAVRDVENGTIFSREEALARSFDVDAIGQVVVLVGPSGSGKSSFIESHLPGFAVVSLDDIRAHFHTRDDQSHNAAVVRRSKEQLREHLRQKQDVVYDATSLRRDFRSALFALGDDYGALVTQVVFQHDADALRRRNRARTHAVSDAVLRRQLEKWQWPTYDEAHRTWVVDDEGVRVNIGAGVLPPALAQHARMVCADC